MRYKVEIIVEAENATEVQGLMERISAVEASVIEISLTDVKSGSEPGDP